MTALAKLQIAKKELGLHDDDYRAILERVTGERSAKGLSEGQIVRVLDVLKRDHGWVPSVVQGGKKGPKTTAKPAEHPTALKARALWISLWQLGAVRDRSESALEAFAKRQLKCERLLWADQQQMFKLIEALKAMAARSGWSQDVVGLTGVHALKRLKINLIAAQLAMLDRGEAPLLHNRTLDQLTDLSAQLGAEIRRTVGWEH